MSTTASGPAPKSKTPVYRIVLYLLLGVAIVAMLVDYRARRASQVAYDKVNALMEVEDGGALADLSEHVARTPEEIRRLMGRDPDGPGKIDGDVLTETYSWRGVFKPYRVYVRYDGAKGAQVNAEETPALLTGVSTKDPDAPE